MKWNFKLFDNLFLGTPLMKGDGEKNFTKTKCNLQITKI